MPADRRPDILITILLPSRVEVNIARAAVDSIACDTRDVHTAYFPRFQCELDRNRFIQRIAVFHCHGNTLRQPSHPFGKKTKNTSFVLLHSSILKANELCIGTFSQSYFRLTSTAVSSIAWPSTAAVTTLFKRKHGRHITDLWK